MKDPRVYLAQILERIERITSYTTGGKSAFLAETLIQDAVIRNLEVIGEAAKQIVDQYRQAHPQVPWRSLTALRDVLIHQYAGVNLDQVWRVVEAELPGLRTAIVGLLPPLDRLESELAGDEEEPDAP